jgi:mRNA-degrading endonuclease RelE of RelBE toxin-antitoxin system
MPYEIRYHPTLRKVLARLDSATHRRILEAIDTLKENPYRGKKLQGVDVGQWRLRVGDYRIRYASSRRRCSFSASDTGERSTDHSLLDRRSYCEVTGESKP